MNENESYQSKVSKIMIAPCQLLEKLKVKVLVVGIISWISLPA